MRLRNKWTVGLLGSAIVAIGSALVVTAQAAPAPQTPPVPETPQTPPQPQTPSKPPKDEKEKDKEKHPRLEKAIEELKAVKLHLEKAPHDFGGHKAEAMKAVTEAIKQLELAVKFDKN